MSGEDQDRSDPGEKTYQPREILDLAVRPQSHLLPKEPAPLRRNEHDVKRTYLPQGGCLDLNGCLAGDADILCIICWTIVVLYDRRRVESSGAGVEILCVPVTQMCNAVDSPC